MIGIYKITNNINGLCYIGQSIHIQRRWNEHCKPSSTSCIAKAIKKYGKENFSFEVLEECETKDLDIKEKYWIEYYNSIIPNGYNIAEWIDSTGTKTAIYSNIDKITLLKIIDIIQNTSLTFKEIATKFNVNTSTISRINSGEVHQLQDYKYPIRETLYNSKKHYCIDCGKMIKGNAIRCLKCHNKHLVIPIENMRVTRDELKKLIRTKSFCEIGRMFNVSDNAIRKWCVKLNLPKRTSEIKKYSDEEWINI